ncbi:hypothetical protein [Segeticoccus rhizosphaerae]|nr:hypothetical protein [Segeticoccus rhizosphaerae]
MTGDDYDAQWRCANCQHWYVVPGLARECERRHADEADTHALED